MDFKKINDFFETLNSLITKFQNEELYKIKNSEDFLMYSMYYWKGISIPIFRNTNGTYNIYFGINNGNDVYTYSEKIIKSNNAQIMFLYENYKNLMSEKPFKCISDVSENELHYILFAYNMKYNVTTCDTAFDHMEDMQRRNGHFVCFPSDWERFYELYGKPMNPPIYVYIANNNFFLDEHLRGTRNNFFKYTPVVYNLTSVKSLHYVVESRKLYPEMHRSKKEKDEDLKYNYMQDYQKYVDMLSYFINNSFENPIETAYSLSYKQFEEYETLSKEQSEPILTKKLTLPSNK